MKSLVCGLLYLAIMHSYSQFVVSGIVLDGKDSRPIPYVNIGIENTLIGTASFENGVFNLEIPNDNIKDSLVFSALGYQRKKISVLVLGDKDSITLEAQNTNLDEVVVSFKKQKLPTIIDGLTKPNYGFLGIYWDGKYISRPDGGSAMAILLNKKSQKIFLKHAQLFIHNNRLPTFDLRVRIMNVKDGKPHHDVYQKNILVSSTKKKGGLVIDLREYQIVLTEPFFLVFEWITSEENSKKLSDKDIDQQITAFSVRDIQEYVGYERKSSMSSWEQSKKVVVANVSYALLN
ncbi:carboxypeptidase-like regulatory domain-containing protein [Muricauda sp. MAR_2010_75]|uniref:carboxypeptidase-like regulatory domain-containing protein n=1 Tax=Allomuricauda sp. MAR_2010_75 TaxID=1250232 RepID=UPI0012E0B507|nr:carboxypeptidase-like regulatory domain-containing protein [Muricauda sp. MAR_2010_75]